MQTLFKRPIDKITDKEYLEGRTLCVIYKAESTDKSKVRFPLDADFKLGFLPNRKSKPIFLSVSKNEFSSLLTDDVQRITFSAAQQAQDRTLKAYMKKLLGGEGK